MRPGWGRTPLLGALSFVLALSWGCASARTGADRGKFDAEFKERVDRLASAYESLDLDRIAAFYAMDALTLTFHVPFKYDTGIPASRATAESYLSEIKELKLHVEEPIEVWRWPKKVWTLRGFYLESTSRSGATVTWAGRHSAMWEKQGGQWVIVQEHFLDPPQVGRPVPPPPPSIAAAPEPEPMAPPTLPPVVAAESPAAFEGHLEDVFFDLNMWDIRADQREALLGDAGFLARHPEIEITVEGHCDERGGEVYNDRLGERRAESVKAFLVESGIAGSRIATVSFGKRRPFETGSGETVWQQNRRAHFIVTKR